MVCTARRAGHISLLSIFKGNFDERGRNLKSHDWFSINERNIELTLQYSHVDVTVYC
jgi:hypothetical protein